MRLNRNGKYIFEYQTPATLNQASPVQNTWYTILDTTSNAIAYMCGVNIEDTNEDLEVKVTIDGETLTGTVSATHSTTYYVYKTINAVARTDGLVIGTTFYMLNSRYTGLQGKSIKIEVRKTTAAGAGNLTGIVTYGVLKPC